MHEILDWLRGIDRFGKFSIRNRGYVSVRGRHHGPGQFQRPGAYGFGAVDFRQAEASRDVTPSAFCGWWQVDDVAFKAEGALADGRVEFWIKGNAAQLTHAGAATECKTLQ
jgi:hypothetical protein